MKGGAFIVIMLRSVASALVSSTTTSRSAATMTIGSCRIRRSDSFAALAIDAGSRRATTRIAMTSSSTSSSMMTTTTLVNGDILRKHVASVVGSLLPPSSSDDASSSSMISPATKSEFGDYQINAAMSLFNRVKREKPKGDVGGEGTAEEVKGYAMKGYASPREFAMGIIDELNPLLDGIATLEVAGPGFVNLRLTDEYLKMALGIMCRDAEVEGGRLGVPVAW